VQLDGDDMRRAPALRVFDGASEGGVSLCHRPMVAGTCMRVSRQLAHAHRFRYARECYLCADSRRQMFFGKRMGLRQGEGHTILRNKSDAPEKIDSSNKIHRLPGSTQAPAVV
jgi:hypothetical protein